MNGPKNALTFNGDPTIGLASMASIRWRDTPWLALPVPRLDLADFEPISGVTLTEALQLAINNDRRFQAAQKLYTLVTEHHKHLQQPFELPSRPFIADCARWVVPRCVVERIEVLQQEWTSAQELTCALGDRGPQIYGQDQHPESWDIVSAYRDFRAHWVMARLIELLKSGYVSARGVRTPVDHKLSRSAVPPQWWSLLETHVDLNLNGIFVSPSGRRQEEVGFTDISVTDGKRAKSKRQEDRARSWASEFALDQGDRWTKGKFLLEGKSRYAGLSDQAWNRIWRTATAANPELAKPGRPPKNP